jgi:hypothetical protein
MATTYPTSKQLISEPPPGNPKVSGTDWKTIGDTVEAIQDELGNDPSTASFTTVKARIDSNATTLANAKGVVVHGSTAGTARPSGFISVEWIGSVTPTNAIDNDTWINTA